MRSLEKNEDLVKGNLLMVKPLHQKINKRTLRLEFAEIAPALSFPMWTRK